jgi:hypothetical protein
MRIIRYVDELKRSASGSAGAWGATRWRRKYLRDSAKKLTVAACDSDPVSATSALGVRYEADCETGGKRVVGAEKMKMAETLMLACRQLALGQDPAPLTGRPS